MECAGQICVSHCPRDLPPTLKEAPPKPPLVPLPPVPHRLPPMAPVHLCAKPAAWAVPLATLSEIFLYSPPRLYRLLLPKAPPLVAQAVEADWGGAALARHCNSRETTGALGGLGQPAGLLAHHLLWMQEDVLVQKAAEERATSDTGRGVVLFIRSSELVH